MLTGKLARTGMSFVAILGAILTIALTNVFAGLLPVTFTGNSQLAVWLVSLLLGLVAYVAIERAMADVRV